VTGCPVCRAAFRGAAICPRCGADLAPLMRLAVESWRLRESARQALEMGDFEAARQMATAADGLQTTMAGQGILAVAAGIEAAHATRPETQIEQTTGNGDLPDK
jgi:hypothetical protein